MQRLLHFTQRHLLWLLLLTYIVGLVAPGPGLALRGVRVGVVPWPGQPTPLTLPMLMLGFLLVVAGLGSRLEALRALVRRPQLLLVGLGANTVYPIAFALVASRALGGWHNADEAQNILVGLAMIGAMPIAGSSTAWAQNANGNLALSLGLVLGSTALSPLLTPIGLRAVAGMTIGDYAEDLRELAGQGSSAFVLLAVVIPSALGLLLRLVVGARRAARVLPALKLLNLVDLLLLNYANAAVALPQIARQPDWDFLALVVAITGIMCAGAFACGWLVARLFGADPADRTAMTYGLGMNNNGTGLVLAASALADHPLVLLPIIFYNLVQQTVAGIVDRAARRRPQRAPRPHPSPA